MSTRFVGSLTFTRELVGSELALLNGILGEDCREHPGWNAGRLTHIDFELTHGMDGIEWDGSEKSYAMDEKINLIIRLMRSMGVEDFDLEGRLDWSGPEVADRGKIVKGADGFFVDQEIVVDGIVCCPECNHSFIPE